MTSTVEIKRYLLPTMLFTAFGCNPLFIPPSSCQRANLGTFRSKKRKNNTAKSKVQANRKQFQMLNFCQFRPISAKNQNAKTAD
jgi:hypothetical protein